jgi:hypothetical protein
MRPITTRRSAVHRPLAVTLLLAVAALLAPLPAAAQPFDAFLTLAGNPQNGYVEVPHSAALNPAAFTVEAWVDFGPTGPSEDCRTIAGKNFLQAWWLGVCNVGGERVLRSYVKGGSTPRNGGVVPTQLTHVALVYGGGQRRHYVNGVLAASFPDAGPATTSTSPLRIGSDVSWNFSPPGLIDEVRLWNVARTQAQIRSAINVRLHSPQPGLVAVWALDGNGDDELGVHDGNVGGSGTGFLTFPVAFGCTPSATTLCMHDRFAATVQWQTTTSGGNASVAPLTTVQSGIFWFFNSTNWEVMVKVLNGCGLNARWWVFSAATTNVAYRLTVLDIEAGEQKIFFNYPGPPAPAVTDTSALASCP